MDWHLELNDMPFDAIKKGKKNPRVELSQGELGFNNTKDSLKM